MSLPFGMTNMERALYAMHIRTDSPAALMPWDWDAHSLSVQHQLECELHMIWQYAQDGLDWLRAPHEWGEHWYVLMDEVSPNDRTGDPDD